MGCQLIKVGIFFINLFTTIWQNAMIEHGKSGTALYIKQRAGNQPAEQIDYKKGVC